jgi:hypothetical protein
MRIELWLAFVAASAVLLVIPGPTILTVISYSMPHGRGANERLWQRPLPRPPIGERRFS